MPSATQLAQVMTAYRAGDRQGVQQMLEGMIVELRGRGLNRGADELDRLRLSLQVRTRAEEAVASPGIAMPNPPRRIQDILSRITDSVPNDSHPYDGADVGEPDEPDPNAIPENLQGLLVKDESPKDLEQIYLYPTVRSAIDTFLFEYNEQEQLASSGLGVRNRMIFGGPPGNGKTVLASAVAKSLGLEMYKADFSQIISAYMGIGPRNLGNIFRYVKERPTPICLFMDEADALITSREMLSGQAAGACAQEYRVMVNTILTGLDEIGSKGLVIAATNFDRNLDQAAIRRFNVKLWLKPPALDGIQKYIQDYQTKHTIDFGSTEITFTGLVGQPWSKVEEFCQEQHRSIVLGRPCSMEMGWIGR